MPGPRYRYGLTLLDSKFLQPNLSAIVKITTHNFLHLRKEQQPIDFCVVCLFPIKQVEEFLYVLVADGNSDTVYIVGGRVNSYENSTSLTKSVYIYNITSDSWTIGPVDSPIYQSDTCAGSLSGKVCHPSPCLSVCLHCLFKSLVSLWRFCDNCFAQGGFGVFPSWIRSHIFFLKTRKRGICATNEEISILDFPSVAKL